LLKWVQDRAVDILKCLLKSGKERSLK
jgi:hypothetical protein